MSVETNRGPIYPSKKTSLFKRTSREVIDRASGILLRAVSTNEAVGDLERGVKEKMLADIHRVSKEPEIDGVIPQNLIIQGGYEAFSRVFMPEIKTRGQENLKKMRQAIDEGRNVMIVANHKSHVDHCALDFALRRNGFTDLAERLTFVQGIKMLKVPAMEKFLSYAYSRLNVWPSTVRTITDEEKSAKEAMNLKARETTKEAFQKGRIIVMYPEGERTKTEERGLIKPKTPMGFLISNPENTAIFPVAIDHTEDVLPPNDWKLKAGVPHVTFCEPMEASELFGPGDFKGGEIGYAALKRSVNAVHSVMIQIARALPEDKRGVYKDRVVSGQNGNTGQEPILILTEESRLPVKLS